MPAQLTYRPLPPDVRLGFSDIEGIGVFAKKDIERGHNFGMSHLKLGSRIIRTPLGGFINHSDHPNCFKVSLRFTNEDDPTIAFNYKIWNLVTTKNIKTDEELTVKYEWYKPVERVVM
jgi:hypothetical protein